MTSYNRSSNIKGIALAYGAFVLVLGIGIDVSARLQDRSETPSAARAEADEASTDDEDLAPKKAAPLPTLRAEGDGERASSKACAALFERQKDIAVEMALAFHPDKNKARARKKIQKEVAGKMEAQRDAIVGACTELPASEVNCVLGEDDLTKWVDCGPGIAKLGQ